MQNYKVGICKNILTFASISNYEKVDSEKITIFTTGISCSKEKIENIKIYNIMTKLADKKNT